MPRLVGDWGKDKDAVERGLEVLSRLEQDSTRGVQIGGAGSPRLDSQVLRFKTPALPNTVFSVEHSLGRVARYFWPVMAVSAAALLADSPERWTTTTVSFICSAPDVPFQVLIA